MDKLLTEMKTVINDPSVEIVNGGGTRPPGPPSPINTEAFRVIEAGIRKHYGTVSLPSMGTGASDKAQMRSKGIHSYGIGPLTDVEDGPLGFGAHSDQERILESELHRFVHFHYDAVVSLAGAGK
jgi:acetylornithine deacetylase/succinyl-diaminopimelate desuccinylase-like protein